MVSHQHKCIFVHIPKTAGSSVERGLWTDFSRKNLFGWPNFWQTGGLQHLQARHIRSAVGEEIFNQYFKFTFVRNPYSKAVSQYYHTVQKLRNLRVKLGIRRDASFKGYAKALQKVNYEGSPLTFVDNYLHNLQPTLNRLFVTRLHVQWQQQYKFVYDEDGKLLVDFVGKFERLQNDFKKICEKINFPDCQLPHDTHGITRPKNKHYSEYYDDETLEIITEIYKKDLEYFDYQFEVPE